MIQYADTSVENQVRQMWKTVFGDDDAYMDIYFRHKYRNHRTLVYMEADKAMASLQMLPYCFTFCDTEIPVAYISGVSTLPEARKKGYMRWLLLQSFYEMAKAGIALALLVPQEAWLLRFYDNYGFAQTFDAGVEELPSLKTLLDTSVQKKENAYRAFDTWFRGKDMTVQKTFDDFCAIVEEAALFGFPPKKNLIGMARIVNAETLLSIFAEKYPQKQFSVCVGDEIVKNNAATFTVDGARVVKNAHLVQPAFHADIRELTQLLLGYHTSRKETTFRSLFPEKMPQMNFMLE